MTRSPRAGHPPRSVPLPSLVVVALLGLSLAVVATGAGVQPAAAQVAPGTSTSGDWATDTFGDPWDFDNPEDFDTAPNAFAVDATAAISGGFLRVSSRNGTILRLAYNWPGVLPWGRDTARNPIDGNRYTKLSYRLCAERAEWGGLFYFALRPSGPEPAGMIPVDFPAGCHTRTIDLPTAPLFPDPALQFRWSGPIGKLLLVRSGTASVTQLDFDWIRLHTAASPATPPGGPQPRLLSPSVQGVGDWAAEVTGDAWDFDQPTDVERVYNVAGGVGGGAFSGTNAAPVRNDPAVVLPQRNNWVDGAIWNRLTIDACTEGSFSLENVPGGGMVSRIVWVGPGRPTWSESQDIVTFPGCRAFTLEMRTDPSIAIHDEATGVLTGWDNQLIGNLRFDPNEDPGARRWSIRNVRLARDAVTSTTFPITFLDAAWVAGATADVWASPTRGTPGGRLLAAGVSIPNAGPTTVSFTGTDSSGARLPRGPWWVNIQIRHPNGATQHLNAEAPILWNDPAPGSTGLQPVGPVRVADSRTGVGLPPGRVAATQRVDIQVAGRPGVPSHGVVAAVVNLTATEAAGVGFVGAHSSWAAWTGTSSLNYAPGAVATAAGVLVPVGPDGRISLTVGAAATHLVVDVTGVLVAGGAGLRAVDPARLLDTRRNLGAPGPVGDRPIQLTVAGVGPVPAGATAVTLNLAADGGDGAGWVSAYPAGTAWPGTSSLNYEPGQAISNLVTVAVGAGGAIELRRGPGGVVHLLADVVGWWGPGGARFTPITPQRIVDTRPASPLVTGVDRPVAVPGVPPDAVAVAGTVTVDAASHPGWLSLRPGGTTWPGTSSVNFDAGLPRANGFVTRLGPGGLVALASAAAQHLVVDITGYWRPA